MNATKYKYGTADEALAAAKREIWAVFGAGGNRISLRGYGLETLPPDIAKLEEARQMNLELTQIPGVLSETEPLIHLDLRDNAIAHLPMNAFSGLNHLSELYLQDNRLTSLPDGIFEGLSQLRRLDLSGNRLASIPSRTFESLIQLHDLSIKENQVTQLDEKVFSTLGELRELYLPGNLLENLPQDLFSNLPELQRLDISSNRLTSVPEEIFSNLRRLEMLYLSHNEFNTFPECILKSVPSLQRLYLQGNNLKCLPENIFANAGDLQVVDLSKNSLTSLPASLENCKTLTGLYLHDNLGLGLTAEVLGPSYQKARSHAKPAAPRSILTAWRALQRGKRALNEAKVILVGRGGAGKTTLRKALMNEVIPEREPRTEGIQLSRFALPVAQGNVGLNIWDFGGQEVMYSTHRFFLTSRSLYILVLDARSGPQDENVDYWLRVVKELGKRPPVLVVLNYVDENPGLRLDEMGWKQKYEFIVGFVHTCATQRLGVGELLEKMQAAVLGHLPEARSDFPNDWFSVKDKLTEMKDKLGREHLPLQEYESLCVAGKVPEDEREVLLCWIRDLGLVSCYPEVSELRNLGVLSPGWLTDGIYALINNNEIKRNGGYVRLGEVSSLLREPKRYAGHERFLLDAMANFRLAFQLHGSTRWLLTALLSENTPEGLADWVTTEGLKLEMRYEVLPEGLVAQFIAAAHLLGVAKGLRRWRNGVELEMEGAKALVQRDVPGRFVRILVQGPGNSPRALLSCIRHQFRAINAGLTPPGEFVPVPGLDADPIEYADLLAREAQGLPTIEVKDRRRIILILPGKSGRKKDKLV